MKKELEQKMYFLVPYQFGSTIHAGIQPLHASWHYLKEHGMTKELKRWAFTDETVVVLSGGTSNDKTGTLNAQIKKLKDFGIKFATFREPDLGRILTSISFLVDERIWNKKKYPDLATVEKDLAGTPEFKKLLKQARSLEKIGIFEQRSWLFSFPLSK